MITAGQKMIDAATALKEMFSETAPEMSSAETKSEKKEAPSPAPEVKKYSFRKSAESWLHLLVKERKLKQRPLTKYGASRLSDVKEEDYPALVARPR